MRKRLIFIIPVIIIFIVFSICIFSNNYSNKSNVETGNSYQETTNKNSLKDLLSEIYKFLGTNYEIVPNSSISCDVKLDTLFNSDDYEKLENIIGSHLSHYTATPYTMKLFLYDVRNIKTDEYKKYFISFYDQPELGINIISQKFIEDNSELEEIKKQIIKRN